MDKYEYSVKIDKIRKMADKGKYDAVAKIADQLDWSRVSDTKLLTTVADAYESVGRYSDAKDTLLVVYDQVPPSRRLVYRLTELSAKEGNFREAEDFYQEFEELSPNDTGKFILRYEISAAKGEPISKLIQILEAYKRRELDEKWSYELARLYHRAGRKDDCVKLCDDIILWFGVGQYVDKAMELKQLYAPLTEEQKEHRENKAKYEAKLQAVEKRYAQGRKRKRPTSATASLEERVENESEAIQQNLAEYVDKSRTSAVEESDEDEYAKSLGKTKEVILPRRAGETGELTELHQALEMSKGIVPDLDLDTIAEAAEEEHQAAMREHMTWSTMESAMRGREAEAARAAEALLRETGEVEEEDLSEAASPAAQSMDEEVEEIVEAAVPAAENTQAASQKTPSAVESALGAVQASDDEDTPIDPNATLEDLLREAEAMLGTSSSASETSTAAQSQTASAADETGRRLRPEQRRPAMAAPDSVKTMLAEEREAASPERRAAEAAEAAERKAREEAAAAKRRRERELAEAEKKAREEATNKKGMEEAAQIAAELREGRKDAAPAVARDTREIPAKAAAQQAARAAVEPSRKTIRCALLETNDPAKVLLRATEALKKIHERLGTEASQAAKITGEKFNSKGVRRSLERLAGRDLIVEAAGALTPELIAELTDELTSPSSVSAIILTDTSEEIRRIAQDYPGLKAYCSYFRDNSQARPAAAGTTAAAAGTTAAAAAPAKKAAPRDEARDAKGSRPETAKARPARPAAESNAEEERRPAAESGKAPARDERHRRPGTKGKGHAKKGELTMQDFAKCVENYARKLECELDEKAALAIYARAEQLMDEGVILTDEVAKNITDEAVTLAEKPSLRGVFSGKYNKDGYLILREQHFMKAK